MGITTYIKTIVALIIFSTMSSMFLPNNSFRKFLELILGVLILSALVHPLFDLFQFEENPFDDWNYSITVDSALMDEEYYYVIEEERLNRIDLQTKDEPIKDGELLGETE